MRNGPRRSGTAGEGVWGRRLRSGIGTVAIAGSALVLAYIAPFIIVVPLIGGFIAGYTSGGRLKDGIETGFVAALSGTDLFLIPILWTASSGTGFAARAVGAAVRESSGARDADGGEG